MGDMNNIDRFNALTKDGQRDMLIDYFSKWADVGDSYIFDLTRVKESFSIGTMSFDDFTEWDDDRIAELVDEFLDWLYSEHC